MMIGTRIEIREHVLADLDAYVQWQSDPEVARHIAWLPKSHAESEAGLLDAISQQSARPRVRFFFAVVHRESGEVIGDVGFTITAPSTGDCGWFIRSQHWRCGYATEAARLLIRHAFQNIGLDRLTASCATPNIASARVMEKCGFQVLDESERRIWYQLPRASWETQAQHPAAGTRRSQSRGVRPGDATAV